VLHRLMKAGLVTLEPFNTASSVELVSVLDH